MGHHRHRQTQKHRKHGEAAHVPGGRAEPVFHSRFERFLYFLRHPPLAAFFTPTPESPSPPDLLPARTRFPSLHSVFSRPAEVKRRMPSSLEHPAEQGSSRGK